MATHKGNNACLNRLTAGQNSVLLANRLSKSVTFLTATTGAVGAAPIATVTGIVSMQLFAVCGTTLTTGAGAAIEVGTALSTDALISSTLGASIDVNEIWHNATPDASIELESIITTKIVTQSVQYEISVNPIDTGEVTFYILWSPISVDGNVELA